MRRFLNNKRLAWSFKKKYGYTTFENKFLSVLT